MRSLARNPSYRPASAAAFAKELGPDEDPTAPLHAPTRVAAVSRRRPRWLWVALAALPILAAIVLGVVLATRGGSSPAPKPPQTVVRPIPRGANAQQQAEKIAAWLRARAARP